MFLQALQIPQIEVETDLMTQIMEIILNPFFIIAVGVVLILIIIIIFLISRARLVNKISTALDQVVLLVKVPKETPEKEEQKKSAKELILNMERLFDNLAGLKAQRSLRSKLFGRTDHFSFEIVVDQEGFISFYVVVPKYLQLFTEQQIQAQFPSAEIDQVKDYNIFSPKGVNVSSYLILKKHWMFPIKTYTEMETDSLAAVINSLSKFEKGESAVIQFVARSAKGEWHGYGAKVALEIQQGKKVSQALADVSQGFLSKIFSGLTEMIFKIGTKEEGKEEITKKPHQLSPMEQEIVKALERKTSKAGLDVNIRIIVSAQSEAIAKARLQNIVNSFAQFSGYEYLNGFKVVYTGQSSKIINDYIYRHLDPKISFILNSEEMASVFHFPLPTIETPNIRWLLAKKSFAPVEVPSEGIILGKNVYRDQEKIIRIKREDRMRHIYIIGRTGTGKSVLISNMAIQDIQNNEGICVIDPHGDLVLDILENIPKERAKDVIYFNPADTERPLGLNLLEYDPKYPEQKTFVINEMINIMDKLYDLRQTGGPMFEQYMRNAMLLVMEHPESGATLMEIPKVLADANFRHYKLKRCKNPTVRDFWIKEAEKAGGEAALSNMTPYITSKLNQFVSNDIMRPIISQQKSSINFRKAMDEGKIVLVNLSKGLIGDLNAYLLGLVIVGKITMSALSRADLPKEERRDFYLYIDEFQNFITETISTILSEARKYRLSLTVAHQYMGQLVKGNDTSIRDAILGTMGTMIVFKIGIEDAEILVKEFAPVFSIYDLVNIEKFNAYVKLLVDNQAIRPFNMKTFPPPKGDPKIRELIIKLSREKYGQNRILVEKEYLERVQKIEKEEKVEEW